MTIFLFANNVNTQLAGSISSSATSLTLSSAANLPTSIPAGQALVLTLNDVATRQNFEIIYATSISGATLSGLQRGQEGTSALAWATGDFAYSPPTAGQMNAFGQLAANNTWSGNDTFSNPIVIASAVSGSTTQAVNQGQFPSTLSASGYKNIPDPNSPTGYFIEQWGTATTTNGVVVNFPFSFPNACLKVWVSESAASSSNWGVGAPTLHASSNQTQTGFTHWTVSWSGSSWTSQNNTCNWLAIGY